MAHLTSPSGYAHLVDRLNRFPQGAPPSETLFALLSLLFSEREAALVAQLPVLPFTAKAAANRWHMDESQARQMLRRSVWAGHPSRQPNAQRAGNLRAAAAHGGFH